MAMRWHYAGVEIESLAEAEILVATGAAEDASSQYVPHDTDWGTRYEWVPPAERPGGSGAQLPEVMP